jgi:hypothetical protein
LKFNQQSEIENQQFRVLSTWNQCHNTPIGAFIFSMLTGRMVSIKAQPARSADAEAPGWARLQAGHA